eukprot:34741_1
MNQDDEVPLPISFEEKKEEHNRGITMTASRALQENSLTTATSQMGAKNISSQTQMKDFGGKSEEIMTVELDGQNKQKGAQTSNIFAIQVVADETNKEEVQSKGFDAEIYNEITSHSVKGQDVKQVLSGLSSVLSNYSNNIDFEVDSEKNMIKNGVVFMSNYYAVQFMIYVVAENVNDRISVFEFRRNCGDALASAKFLGDIKTKFFGAADDKKNDDDDDSDDNKEKEKEKEEESTLISLDLNVNDLELKLDDNEKERMMIHEALISDDYVGDVDENTENYLYTKLAENKVISQNIVDHKKLCMA